MGVSGGRRVRRALSVLAVWGALATTAVAQNTTVTASALKMGGQPVTIGQVGFLPVDATGRSVPFSSAGLNAPLAYACNVVNGAIGQPCVVPDSTLTNPANVCYNVQIAGTAPGFSGRQIYTLPQVCISGASWALDAYVPPAQTTNMQPLQQGSGAAAPSGSCNTSAVYEQLGTANAWWFCNAGTWVQASGSGGGSSITFPSGLLYGSNSTSAPSAATSLQIQNAIGVGVYDVSGAATAAQTAAQTYASDATHITAGTVAPARMPTLFIDPISGGPSAFYRGTAVNPLQLLANRAIAQNHVYFSDNTDGYQAGLTYTCGTFVADTMFTMWLNPSYFTATQKLNVLTKLIGAKNANGEFPECIAADGTAASSAFYSAWDAHHAYATGDGWISAPILLYDYYRQTGDLAPYTANVAAIKTALARVPKNGTNHLITVVAGNEYVPCVGFQEQQRFTSDNACASVFYAYDLYVLKLMATAAGDATNASFFQTEYNLVAPAILTEFTDGTTQMLLAASAGTGAQNVQVDVMTSVLAVWLETQAPGFSLIGSTQAQAMSSYLTANNSTLTNSGFVRQFAAACGTVGQIPVGGGAPYTASPYTSTQYQCGYWGFPVGWYAYTLNKTAAGGALIGPLLAAFNSFSGNTTEWLNVGSSTPQGTSVLTTTPQGAAWAAGQFPANLGFSSDPSLAITPTAAYGTTPITATLTGIGANFGAPIIEIGPSLSAGGRVAHLVGQDLTNYDTAYFAYNHSGNNSQDNFGSLGMFNADNALAWFGDTSVAVGYTARQIAKFAVNGNAQVDGGSNTYALTLTSTFNNPTASLLKLQNSAITSTNWIIDGAHEPSLATNSCVGYTMGQNFAPLDVGYIRLCWAGDNSQSSFVSLGFGWADDLLQVYPNGSIRSSVATQPTGSCSVNGSWLFTQDGHGSFCSAGTWVSKI